MIVRTPIGGVDGRVNALSPRGNWRSGRRRRRPRAARRAWRGTSPSRSAGDHALERLRRGLAGGILVVDELHVAAERDPGEAPARAVAVVEAEDLPAEADGEGLDRRRRTSARRGNGRARGRRPRRVSTSRNCRMVSSTPGVEVARFASVSISLLSAEGQPGRCPPGPAYPLMVRAKTAISALIPSSLQDCAPTHSDQAAIVPASASASAARISSSVLTGAMQPAALRPPRACRRRCGQYRESRCCRARKASTATSLAALRTAGAVPPRCEGLAGDALSAGKRASSGASKVSAAERAPGRAARVGAVMRSGQASARAMGVRMSGGAICASTEPSV